MQIYLVKGYLDVAATTLADAKLLIAALANPSTPANAATIANVTAKLETLVQSDTGEPMTVSSIDDAAGTISSWVTDVDTAVALGLGNANAGGTGTLAQILEMDVAGSTRTGILELNTIQLTQAMQMLGCGCSPRSARQGFFTLQIRRTDTDGGETMALLQVTVAVGVLSVTPSPMPVDSYLTAAEIAALYVAKTIPPMGPTEHPQASTAVVGAIDLVPPSQRHIETITVTGAAGTRTWTVTSPDGIIAGSTVDLVFLFPLGASNGTQVNIQDERFTILFSFTRNNDEPSATFLMYRDSDGALRQKAAIIPAFAV